jgi:hypothetical protein
MQSLIGSAILSVAGVAFFVSKPKETLHHGGR